MKGTRMWSTMALFVAALSLSGGRGAQAEQAAGVKGKLYVSAAATFLLYVNDKEELRWRKNTTVLSTELTLKPGDVIKAQAIYQGGGHGGSFAMIFMSEDKKVIFTTDTSKWLQFEPKDRLRWWVMDPKTVDTWKVYKAPSQTPVTYVQGEAGIGCHAAIWGAKNEWTAHLFRAVSAEDLKPR